MAYGDKPAEATAKAVEALVLKKLEDARKKRQERAPLINETYRLASPWRRTVQSNAVRAKDEPALSEDDIADMLDSTLAETQADFASDMIAQFTPESEPWTKFKTKETVPDEMAADVRRIISNVSAQVFEAISESSYYDAAPQCFQDLGNGTMGVRARDPDRGGDPFVFEPIEPADLLLCHSPARGLHDARFTEGVIPFGEFKQLYGRVAVYPPNFRKPNDDQDVTVVDGFYRCWEHVRGDRAWRRIVMLDNKLVYEKYVSDDDDVDVIVARWEVNGRSPWGVGPSFRAQPAQRALNELTAIMMVSAAKHADTPGFYVDDGVVNLDQGFEAGDMIPTSENFDVKWWEPKGQLDITFFTEADLRNMIRHAHFQDKPEQKGKTPPTAEQWGSLELRSRARWEIPRGKIVREWVLPIVLWTKKRLEMQGRLGPYRVDQRFFTVIPNSPFAKARDQEKVVRASEILAKAQAISPETVAIDIDIPATLANIKDALNDELVVIRPEDQRRELMAQAVAAQQGAPVTDEGQ